LVVAIEKKTMQGLMMPLKGSSSCEELSVKKECVFNVHKQTKSFWEEPERKRKKQEGQ